MHDISPRSVSRNLNHKRQVPESTVSLIQIQLGAIARESHVFPEAMQ